MRFVFLLFLAVAVCAASAVSGNAAGPPGKAAPAEAAFATQFFFGALKWVFCAFCLYAAIFLMSVLGYSALVCTAMALDPRRLDDR